MVPTDQANPTAIPTLAPTDQANPTAIPTLVPTDQANFSSLTPTPIPTSCHSCKDGDITVTDLCIQRGRTVAEIITTLALCQGSLQNLYATHSSLCPAALIESTWQAIVLSSLCQDDTMYRRHKSMCRICAVNFRQLVKKGLSGTIPSTIAILTCLTNLYGPK